MARFLLLTDIDSLPVFYHRYRFSPCKIRYLAINKRPFLVYCRPFGTILLLLRLVGTGYLIPGRVFGHDWIFACSAFRFACRTMCILSRAPEVAKHGGVSERRAHSDGLS